MIKYDARHTNRKSQRDLTIEMDLWCFFGSKHLTVEGASLGGKPINGKIVDISYDIYPKSKDCRLTLDNGTEYSVPVKYGRPVIAGKIKLT